MEGHWNFRGGGGSRKPKFLKESIWNFQRGGGIQTKKPPVGGVWIFYGTIHLEKKKHCHPVLSGLLPIRK